MPRFKLEQTLFDPEIERTLRQLKKEKKKWSYKVFAKNNLQAHRIVTSGKVFLENECRTHRD